LSSCAFPGLLSEFFGCSLSLPPRSPLGGRVRSLGGRVRHKSAPRALVPRSSRDKRWRHLPAGSSGAPNRALQSMPRSSPSQPY
jgi:hypothetical protein